MAHTSIDPEFVASRADPSLRIRLPRKVLQAMTNQARKNGRSRNSEIVVALARAAGLLNGGGS
jgi:hypothetical protein